MASVVSYRDSPAGATPDCFRAYGYSGRDAPACAFECRCVYNSGNCSTPSENLLTSTLLRA